MYYCLWDVVTLQNKKEWLVIVVIYSGVCIAPRTKPLLFATCSQTNVILTSVRLLSCYTITHLNHTNKQYNNML